VCESSVSVRGLGVATDGGERGDDEMVAMVGRIGPISYFSEVGF